MNTLRAVLSLAFVFFTGIALVANQSAGTHRQAPYHDRRSVEPLPATLDPNEFQENHSAFVAYSLAARVPGLLYQMPCFCGCDRTQAHRSLLDCFVGRHGGICLLCQKEVLFCFAQDKTGKTPVQIREALNSDQFSKFAFEKYAHRFYNTIRKGRQP
jgi:hypothetical protein